jgi:PAS domain S-box-containing protein
MSKPVILCVDDESIILTSLKIELKKVFGNDYYIELAESGKEALALIDELQENGYEIAVVIADYFMPNMNGDELLERIHVNSPQIVKIILTGQINVNTVSHAVKNNTKLYRYITKPWQTEKLRLTIREAVYCYLQEKILAEEHAKLKQLDNLKNEFLSNISHELRTPLNSIIGFSSVLYEQLYSELSETYLDMLSTIVQSGHKLESLVSDILDFSRLKRNNIEPKLKPLNMSDLIRTVLSMQQTLLAPKRLKLINTVPHNLPLVLADENRTQQVLYNLIGNAIKFTEHGYVKVSAEIVQRNIEREMTMFFNPAALKKVKDSELETISGKLYLAVTVSDTGIGIPTTKIDRIFESFEQVDGSTTRRYEGTGLGLSLIRQLLLLQHGEIFVKSTLSSGSQFTFILPLAAATSKSSLSSGPEFIDDSKTLAINNNELVLHDVPKTIPPPFQILIVDDEPTILQILISYLSSPKYIITTATNGIEALRKLEDGLEPDLILLDVMLPQMSGYEVTLKIREKWRVDELPIVLLSMRNQVSDLVDGLGIGANDYIVKPVTKKELLARITTHLTLKSLEAENRLIAKVFQSTQVGIVITDTYVRIVKVNQAYISMFGYTTAEIFGRNPSIISSGQHDSEFYQALWDVILTTGYWHGEIVNRCKNGEFWNGELTISAIKDKRDKVTHYVGYFIER